MEIQDKQTVQIVQDLIAIHSLRKEATDRLGKITGAGGKDTSALTQANQQSKALLPQLLDELSAYGDGVPSEADRNNEYMNIWNDALARIDALAPDEAIDIFFQLEDSLHHIYTGIAEKHVQLPAALQKIIQSGQSDNQKK